MRNIVIVAVVVASIGYMFVLMFNKYETIKETNNQINKTNQKTVNTKPKE